MLSKSTLGQTNDIFYQNPTIDSLDNKKLFLTVDNLNFFKDNEFASEKISGYTLPGFRLNPKLSYIYDKNILLEVGISLLRYWGTNVYPSYSYTSIPFWRANDYQKGFHFLPFFRAQISLKDNLSLVFGNLYVSNNHNLILPLYNTELNLSSDPEAGIQLLYNFKYFSSDLWFNWQSFIFRNDTHQEVFTFGFSSKTDIVNADKKFQIYLPLQIITQHRGGELDTLSSNLLQTWMNYAGGIGTNYRFNKLIDYLSFELYYAGFIQNVGCISPFDKGYGLYSKLSIGLKDLNINFSYWTSKDFISIFGSPNFINISTSTENMVFNKIRMFHSQLDYCYKRKPNYSLGFEINCFYYFPFTGYRKGYGEIISSDYADFSFGIYLKLNSKFLLYKFKE